MINPNKPFKRSAPSSDRRKAGKTHSSAIEKKMFEAGEWSNKMCIKDATKITPDGFSWSFLPQFLLALFFWAQEPESFRALIRKKY